MFTQITQTCKLAQRFALDRDNRQKMVVIPYEKQEEQMNLEMKCPECGEELRYRGLVGGIEEWYCAHCHQCWYGETQDELSPTLPCWDFDE